MGDKRVLYKCATAVTLCAACALHVRHPAIPSPRSCASAFEEKTPSFSFCQVDMYEYDSKVDRVCIVIKLKIIPCNTEFAFGVTVPVCLCRVRLQVVTRVVQGHFVKGQL